MKVEQFYNKNQFIIKGDDKIIFQSYKSTICVLDNKNKTITFGKHYNYSNTTSKHLYLFLEYYVNMIELKHSKNKKKTLQEYINNKKYNNYTIILDNMLV